MNVVHDAKGRLRSVPLRLKLVASVLALVAAALVVISVSTAYFLRSYLVGQIDTELSDSVNRFESIPPTGITLPSDYLVVLTSRGSGEVDGGIAYDTDRFQERDLPSWPTEVSGFRKLEGDPFTVRARDSSVRWRVLYTQLPNGQMALIGEHLTDVDMAVRQLVWIDLLVGGAVLISLASVGAGIVRTSLKRLV